MSEYTCPKCGHRRQDDLSVPCPGCSSAITAIATPEDAAHAKITSAVIRDGAFREGLPPFEPAPTLSTSKAPVSLFGQWMPYAVVALILLTAAGLLTPVVQKMRQTAARTQSTKNLQKIGLAMHSFHDANKRLPFNGTVSAKAGDNTSGSWAFQILPFLDQKSLFEQPNTNGGVAVYMCPGRGRPTVSTTGAWTDYFINPWINELDGIVDAPDVKRTFVGITDGCGNTIFVGQGIVDPELYWSNVVNAQSVDIFRGGDPAMARRSTTNQADKSGDASLNWGGPFPQGCLLCFADATVRMFRYGMTGSIIRNGRAEPPSQVFLGNWLTPCGGEFIDFPDT
jgi:hypothetical protein